jgi:hypothetical protein
VCPENIDLVGMLLELRRALPPSKIAQNLQTRMHAETTRLLAAPRASAVKLLADVALSMHPVLLARMRTLLGNACAIAVGNDSGADITQALEIGVALPPQRVERLLASLRPCKTIVVADGLLLRHLREWLPHARIFSVGVALSTLPAVRQGLRSDDLYIIEPRAYHGDYARLVKYYDQLRTDTGCALNLDLQRIAIPATLRNMAQREGREAPADGERVRWLLHGRPVSRIVVESEDDRVTFERYCDVPVVHLAEVAGAAIAQRNVA